MNPLTFWKSFTPLGKGLAVVIFLMLLVLGYKIWLDKTVHTAKEAGRAETVIEVQDKVIKDVETANEARQDNAARDDSQRHADCLRRARNPENCQ